MRGRSERDGEARPSQAAMQFREGMKYGGAGLKDARDRGLIWGRRLRAMLRTLRSHPAFVPFVGIGFWVGKQVRTNFSWPWPAHPDDPIVPCRRWSLSIAQPPPPPTHSGGA